MADRQQSDKDDKDTPASRPATQPSAAPSRQTTVSPTPSPPHAAPTTVQQAVVHEAAAQSVPQQSQSSSDPARTVSAHPDVTGLARTSVAALELAVAGEPLHKVRRYLELIQVECVSLPNSEQLASFLVTVRAAQQQLATVPATLDDTP